MTEEIQKIIDHNKSVIEMATGDKYNGNGIYAIYIDKKLVYLGKSADMITRVANHMYHIDYQDQPKTNKYVQLYRAKEAGHKITFDVFMKCDEIDVTEAKLIREYLPPLNIQIPKIDNPKSYDTNYKAKKITFEEIVENGDN